VNPPEPPAEPTPHRRPWPPELAFLHEFRALAGLPPEEALPRMRQLLEQVRRHAPLLRQHGLDPDHLLGTLQPAFEQSEAAQQQYELAQDQVLHAAADVADTMGAMVDGLERAVAQFKEQNPFHPDLTDWEEKLQVLREAYPKLPED
jgi:hypothetical protein